MDGNISRTTTALHLTAGRVLARNTGWNIVGQVLPMAVGIVAIPPLIRLLGIDRFGLLSLAWVVIGYFSLFDLGLGRALTKLVADKLGINEEHSIPPLVWTSLLLLLLLGVVGGLVALFLSPWLVHAALRVPAKLQPEALLSFQLLSLSIPIVTVTSGLRGILEAQQRFAVLNSIRVPTSIYSLVGPLMVLPFSRSLVPVIIVLIFGRLAGAVAHLVACLHFTSALRHKVVLQGAVVLPVIRFGGWMTISNIIGPIMSYLDRFFVGGLLSVGIVTYYTAPFDLVGRLTFVYQAVAGVLFPAFAISLLHDSDRTALLFRRGTKWIFLALFPLILATVAFAPEILRLWLGGNFAQKSEFVLRWLAAGVFFNSLASVPFALIQSAGKPSVTAKLHLIELPLYLFGVWVLTKHLGINGTAIAWTCRTALDAILLFLFANPLVSHRRPFMSKLLATTAAGMLVLYAVTLFHAFLIRTAFASAALVAFVVVSWFWTIAPEERALMMQIGGRIS